MLLFRERLRLREVLRSLGLRAPFFKVDEVRSPLRVRLAERVRLVEGLRTPVFDWLRSLLGVRLPARVLLVERPRVGLAFESAFFFERAVLPRARGFLPLVVLAREVLRALPTDVDLLRWLGLRTVEREREALLGLRTVEREREALLGLRTLEREREVPLGLRTAEREREVSVGLRTVDRERDEPVLETEDDRPRPVADEDRLRLPLRELSRTLVLPRVTESF